ncbi:MAG: RidA family protein [Proteobacteria bacterium]|nr:RidA family protein [Pseudomonadota bacterium]
MSRSIVATPAAPAAPASFGRAVKTAGLALVPGPAPIDPATGQAVKGSVQAQVAQCIRNISVILETADSSFEKAVRATLIFADDDDFAGAHEEWMRWFPRNPPARQGAKMPARIPDMKMSIALIAGA